MADVIIVDPIQVDLVFRDFFSWVVMIVLTQVKEGHYCDHYPMYIIFPLTIEVFECFDQQFNNFLHQCVNMAWMTKGIRGLPLSMLCSFYTQKMLVDLQRVQVSSILNWAITIREGFFRLGTLWGLPPLSLIDMLHANGGDFNI